MMGNDVSGNLVKHDLEEGSRLVKSNRQSQGILHASTQTLYFCIWRQILETFLSLL